MFVAITLFFSIMTAASAGAEADRDCSLELGLILLFKFHFTRIWAPGPGAIPPSARRVRHPLLRDTIAC